MTIQLIGFAGSTYTMVVLGVLEELGLPTDISPPANFSDIKTPEYLAEKHPFGKIPVLFDDGFRIYESRAIARYLVNKYQGSKTSTILIPSDVQKAALVDQFVSVETSYFTPPLQKLVYQVVFTKFHGRTTDPEVVKEAREEINKVLDVYEKILEGKDYLVDEFSLADIVHYPYAQYAIKNGHDDLFNDPKRPNVARWVKNITNRESWEKVIAKHDLFKAKE